jgi:hemoglobin
MAVRVETSVASNTRFPDGRGSSGGHISSVVACGFGRYRPDLMGPWRYCVRLERPGNSAVVRHMGGSTGRCPGRGSCQLDGASRRAPNRSPMSGSLYDRIGRREGIATLLRHFYADVRQHALIGPIFNQQIKDWTVHLARIGEFWARITGGPSVYSGQMPAKHFGLGLDAGHFGAWLQLWECNCRCYCEAREAQEMIDLAHETGRRLRSILSRPPKARTFNFARL